VKPLTPAQKYFAKMAALRLAARTVIKNMKQGELAAKNVGTAITDAVKKLLKRG
jgi:hypothetical protein